MIGIWVQVSNSIIYGWFFILAASVLMILSGKSRGMPHVTEAAKWENVTITELEEAQKLIKDSNSISNADSLSLFSYAGMTGIILLVFGLVVAGAVIFINIDNAVLSQNMFDPVLKGGSVTAMFAVDAVLLLAPIWLSGRVSSWQPPNMREQLQQLMSVYELFSKNPKLEFQPSMSIAKTANGSVPMECKLLVKIKDADPNFIGIQVQTSFNDVQGTKYPYTYCVLLAKPALKLIQKVSSVDSAPPADDGGLKSIFADENTKKEAQFARFNNALIETKQEGDVQIAVVRQNTTGVNGYTTSVEQAQEVFGDAYALATKILAIN